MIWSAKRFPPTSVRSEGGAEVSLATDLPGAIEQISGQGPFDLVLLDYNMPGMTGLDGLARALEANGGKGVAILSGSAPARTAQDALDAGAIGFIPKTMGAQSLLKRSPLHVRRRNLRACRFDARRIRGKQSPAGGKAEPTGTGSTRRAVPRPCRTRRSPASWTCRKSPSNCMCAPLCRKLDAKNRTQAALTAKDAGLY